jgi:preprotein translocase subunit Sec63
MPYYDQDFKEEMLEPLQLERRARELLGVSEKATPAEVKRAYWRLARAYHPDLGPDGSSRREEFIAVADAYDILTKQSSPVRRYFLRRKPIHLPRVLDGQEYWRWWLGKYGDLL